MQLTTAAPSHGHAVLRDPHLNRGTAFTHPEREALGLDGLLPSAVQSLADQAWRTYQQYCAQPTVLAKNTFLAALHDRNRVLYFKVLEDHLKELLPVVYAPGVADAIQSYSHEFQRPHGVYLSVDDPDGVDRALRNYGLGPEDVDLLVATDAEQILGIGDWGANGIVISIGKLAIYTAAAGIDPARVIPVMLDVGTDRESLLNDPLYVGSRHRRVRGDRYDALVSTYVESASRLFPNALLHFEDFGASNARRILRRYRRSARVFNDDLQGTGAVALAALIAGLRIVGTGPREQRLVIFGAGTAGVGIADQVRALMIRAGLDAEEATRRVWCVDRQGLLVEDMPDLRDDQRAYARTAHEVAGWGSGGAIGLAEVVARVHPTILVGTSTVGGAFTQPILRELAAGVERPIILPLSNPTERIEVRPEDAIAWTEGRALLATAMLCDPVSFRGAEHVIAQANNALVYPGIGLGTIVARADIVTDTMLLAAAEAMAGLVDTEQPGVGLLPPVEELRAMSVAVAVAVARQAVMDGVAQAEFSDISQAVLDAMWHAAYPPLGVT